MSLESGVWSLEPGVWRRGADCWRHIGDSPRRIFHERLTAKSQIHLWRDAKVAKIKKL
jgi:hypothetical protein